MSVETDFSEDVLAGVVRQWDLDLKQVHREQEIAGSPERSEFRVVIEDRQERLFILEQIFSRTLDRKRFIAGTLARLADNGLDAVIPYRKTREGNEVVPVDGMFWQLQPFRPGLALERPDYAFEEWRGRVLAAFLIDLKCSALQEASWHTEVFSLPQYITRLMSDITRCDPQYLERISPVFAMLRQSFFPIHDTLETGLCHGDYHPINVLWSSRGILGVIDWEFCGNKVEIYDAANMVGCLGIEHPDALVSGCVLRFLHDLKAAGIYTPQSWSSFWELLIAIRFGWMAEWLRKKDLEMVEMECDYWEILVKNKNTLKEAWGIIE